MSGTKISRDRPAGIAVAGDDTPTEDAEAAAEGEGGDSFPKSPSRLRKTPI